MYAKGNFSRFLFTFCTILLVSCFNNDLRQESPYKGEILNYLKQLKSIANETQAKKIDELVSVIDFTKVEIHRLRTTEKAVIADLRSMDSFGKTDKIKAVFYLNQNEIVRSSVVTFNDKVKPLDYDQVILSVLNMDDTKNSYSGRISFYSPFQHLQLFDEFENGKLNINGIATNKTTKDEAGRVAGCLDWYLNTTYYYSDGSTSTTSLYLYTSCSLTGCETQAYRLGRISGNCSGGTSGGGSGGASAGLAFPTSPKNNDTYEFTDKEGKYTKYVFDSQTSYWVIVETILPAVVVLKEPDSYPFLQILYPVNDQMVLGTDNLIYKYNGSSANWVGLLYMIPSGPETIITNKSLYLNCLDRNNPATLTIYAEQPIPGSRALVNLVSGSVGHSFIGITQTLNNGTLTVTRLFGFYPETSAYPGNPIDPGVLKVNESHDYNISLSIQLTPAKLSELLDYVIDNTPGTYNLGSSADDVGSANCTSYAIRIANKFGANLPNTTFCWTPPGGCGNNPGDFGEDLRNKRGSVSSLNSKAPSNSGCPADLP